METEQSAFIRSLIPKGFYVDVGAYDGITGSNTLALAQNGWGGVCVEPNPKIYKKLVENRDGLGICLNNVISTEVKDISFICVSGYAEQLSCVKDDVPQEHLQRIRDEISKHGGSYEEIKVQSIPLKEVFKDADYLSIDAECHEYYILKSIDFKTQNIKYISFEENPYTKYNCTDFLKSKGYEYVKTIGVDIFMRNINGYTN